MTTRRFKGKWNDYVQAKLDEPRPLKPNEPGYISAAQRKHFRLPEALKPGAEFRRKAKKTDPLKVLKRIL
jgi:hypothetical protein